MSLDTLRAFGGELTSGAAISRAGEPRLTFFSCRTPRDLAFYRDGPMSAPFLKLADNTWRWMRSTGPEDVRALGAVRVICAVVELSAEFEVPTPPQIKALAESWPAPDWRDAPPMSERLMLHDARAIVAAWGLARAVNVPLEGGEDRPRWPIAGPYTAWRDAADLAHILRSDVRAWGGDW